ncbi:L-threonylcarbamoyladenylate synthase [Lucifera butyrica]|uniref:L-threonylcarbamoyladenylate synthase n=1 Tax=Lucifera butyrica TaxID=1351585 RepID=UPI000F035C23
MVTEYYTVDKEHPDITVLERGAVVLRRGRLVAFPTETVYGLGANGLDERAVGGIYEAKGRPSDNPLILHIADKREVEKLAREIPANAAALMDAFWPGPLTLVLKRTPAVPDVVTGGLDTVAIRLPASPVARELIRLAGIPVAAPSANTSGRPSPTTAGDVLNDLDGKIEVIIDAGPCDIGVESTVIDCTTPVPTLLRPGGVTLEQLMAVLGEVEVDPGLAGRKDVVPRSPGMKYRHYAPNAPLILLEGNPGRIRENLQEKIKLALEAGQKVGAVVSQEMAGALPAGIVTAIYGSRRDPGEAAAGLYTALRHFDSHPVDIIYAEGIEEQGLGLAVMNRLRKASGYRILTV